MSEKIVTPIQRLPVRLGNQIVPFLTEQKLMPTLGGLEEMLDAASRNTGLTDFGAAPFKEPLRLLLDDLAEDKNLHPMGRFFHREYLLKFLKARLKLIDAYGKTPKMENEKVGRPIIILGLPRTGTTRLFNIMAKDARHRTLTLWESYRPVPAPKYPGPQRDLRRLFARTERDIAYFLGPDLPSVHHLAVDGPEECIHLLSTTFLSWIFMLEYDVPHYHDHFLSCDHTWAYEEYAEILRYLQTGYMKERWLLKSPTHIFGLSAILEVFPDACIVQTHRDPLKVVASNASLAMVARGMGSSRLNPHRVGDQIFRQLDVGLKRLLKDREAVPQSQILDVAYADTVRDPMGVVEAIYDKFGIELTKETRQAMDDEINSKPQHHKGKHSYDPADFGFSRARVDQAFKNYQETFNIPVES